MTDVALIETPSGGDIQLVDGDLVLDQGLETAVRISVLSDARASADPNVPELEQDLRGSWFDRSGDRWGSLLWTLERAKRTQEALALARESVASSLKWMIDDGIASKVEVAAAFDATGALELDVQISRGSGRKYDALWAGTPGVAKVKIGPLVQAPPPVNPPPELNVIIIPHDDGGGEFFNFTGLRQPTHGFALTPHLDALRAAGVTFKRAFANPICGPTRARLMTGRYAFHSSLGGNLDGPNSLGYQFGVHGGVQTETLLMQAVRLGRDGTDDMSIGLSNFVYALGWFGKCHLMADAGQEDWPVRIARAGRYIGCQPNVALLEDWAPGTFAPLGPTDPGYVTPAPNSGHFHYRETSVNFGQAAPGYSSKIYGNTNVWPAGGPYVAWDPTATPNPGAFDAVKNYRDAVSWFNTRTQPAVLYLAWNPPHANFQIPPYTMPDTVGVGATMGTVQMLSPGTQAAMTALDGGSKGPGYEPPAGSFPDLSTIAVYKANIEFIDSLIGMLMARLDPAKLANTIVIFAGDNGTVSSAVDTPYFADEGKRSPFYMGAAVPMIVWGGAGLIAEPGRDTDHLTHSVDIFSTVLELTKCPAALWNPTNRTIDGRSFAALLTDPDAPPHRSEIYNDIFLPLDGSLNPPPGGSPIDPTKWVKSCLDGVWHVIAEPTGVSPPYKFFKCGPEVQPASGLEGYIEAPADDLYPFVLDGTHHQIANAFNTLLTRVNAILAT